MKLYWRHFFGNQKRNDIILSDVWAEVKYYEEKDAIESGWLYQSGYWYQSRSTRLNLKGYDKKINLPKNYSYRFESPDKIDMNKLDSIYKQYITVKNFIDFWNPLEDMTRSKFVVIYDDNNEPVAFTKMNMYNGAIEGNAFAWDYKQPKHQLGKKIIDIEAHIALELGYEHLYQGYGYEECAKYKADFFGFEWWTGTEWSGDKVLYKLLCENDSSAKTLEEIMKGRELYNLGVGSSERESLINS